jgi:hypothetical protein
MDDDEAIQLVSRHTQDLEDVAKRDLAETLDCRPLAIVHGCACFRNAPYNGNLALFLDSLRENVAVVLESYGDDEDTTITAIYRMIFDSLAHQPPYVLLSLDLVLLTHLAPSLIESLRLVWPSSRAAQGISDDGLSPEDEAILNKGLRIIERWSLVRPSVPYFQMHELTRSLITSIRGEALVAAAIQAFETVSRRLDISAWIGGRPIPNFWPQEIKYMLTSIDNVVRGAAIKAGSPLSEEDDPDPMCRVPALFLRSGRQQGDVSADFIDFARSILATPGISTFRPLETESLELGILDEAGDVLDLVRDRRSDSYVYEALLSGDFRPLTEAYTSGLIDEALLHIDHPLGVSRPLTPAQHSYALGVFHFQRCEWEQAELRYRQSSDLYSLLADEKPEFGLYVVETQRRLVELFLRRGDLNSAEERFAELLSENMQLVQNNIIDALLSRRLMQTGLRIHSEMLLRGALHRDVIKKLLVLNQDLISNFVTIRSPCPLVELEFSLGLIVGLVDNRKADALLERLTQRCKSFGYRTGSITCQAGRLKIAIAATPAGEYPETFARLADGAIGIAEILAETSPFWHADILCSALACAILGKLPNARVVEIRARAEEAASSIGRADKVEAAEEVAGGAPPYYLFRG